MRVNNIIQIANTASIINSIEGATLVSMTINSESTSISAGTGISTS